MTKFFPKITETEFFFLKACFLPKDEVDPEVTAAAAAAIEAEVDTAVTEVVFIVDDDTDPGIYKKIIIIISIS